MEARKSYLGVDEGYANPVVVKQHPTFAPKRIQLLRADVSHEWAEQRVHVEIKCEYPDGERSQVRN